MNSETLNLQVTISYGQARAEFSGDPQQISLFITEFLLKNVPEIELAHEITVRFSTKDLIEKFKDLIKITPEGPRVWPGELKLSDKEIVSLQLVASRISFETGGQDNNALSIQEIQTITSLNGKSISSRLSEVSKLGYVEKDQSQNSVKFRITTQGIDWLIKTLSKKSFNTR